MDNKTPTMIECGTPSPTPMPTGYSTPKKQMIRKTMPSAPKKMKTGRMLTNNRILQRRGLKQLPALVI